MILDETMITIAVAGAFFLLALLLATPMLRRALARRRMEHCIAARGAGQLRNVLLEDGMGGHAFFERLLMTPHDIRFVVSNAREGIIFAGERMDSWAQVQGQRTSHFPNPLYSMESLTSCLRYHLPQSNITGMLLFIGNCSFPKGKPENVHTLKELMEESKGQVKEAVLPVVEHAWEALLGKVRKVDPSTEGYLLPIKEPFPWLRALLVVLLLAAGGVWLNYRL